MSPSFLSQRRRSSEATPDGANFVLSGYEVASRLSYMLWGACRTTTLFTAAAARTG